MIQPNEPRAETGEAKAATAVSGARIGPRPLELVGGAWLFLVAGLIGGAVAWWTVQRFDEPFKSPMIQGMSGPTREQQQLLRRAEFGNVVFVYTVFGAIVAATFAVAEGIWRKRPDFCAVGLLTGLGLGAVFGAAGGAIVTMVFRNSLPALMDDWIRSHNVPFNMVRTMVAHGVGWAITGLGIGLGLALPTLRGRIIIQAPFAGMVGGLVSALIYVPVVATLDKTAQTDLMVAPPGWNRFAWFLTTAGLMGLIVGGLGKSRRPAAPATSV